MQKKKLFFMAALLAAGYISSVSVLAQEGAETQTETETAEMQTDNLQSEEDTIIAGTETEVSGLTDEMDQIRADAKADGALYVYGSCPEEYLEDICEYFENLYSIPVEYECISAEEIYQKVEAGEPLEADVWFGETVDEYYVASQKDLLEPCETITQPNSIAFGYSDPDHKWQGVYQSVLGFVVKTDEIERLDLAMPESWKSLLDEELAGLIVMPNPGASGVGKTLLNTLVQVMGHDEALAYLLELDQNVALYTLSGCKPVEMAASGESVVGVGALYDGYNYMLHGYEGVELIVPEDGTSFGVFGCAVLKGAEHPDAARLWMEYTLSPDFFERKNNVLQDSYLFPLVAGMTGEPTEPETEQEPEPDTSTYIRAYDFEDAKQNTGKYLEEYFEMMGDLVDERFETE